MDSLVCPTPHRTPRSSRPYLHEERGTIEWVDDGLPYAGVTDGAGGVIWQEN